MLNKPTESTGGNSIDKGVFLSEGKVIKVVDKSTHPDFPNREVTMTSKGKSVDILFEMTYKDGDTERTKKIFGAYEKDQIDGTITNWRSWGNEALIFIFALLTEDTIRKGITPTFAVTQSLLDALAGKVFKEVRYCSGSYHDGEGKEKLSTNTWKYFPHTVSDDEITAQWNAAKGKIKNYKPAIADKLGNKNAAFDAAFPFGENKPQVNPDDIM